MWVEWGRGLVENVKCGWRRLAENVRIPSNRRGWGLKLLKKPSYDI